MGKAQVSIETLQMIKDMIEGKSATQIAGEYHYSGTSPITKRVIQACEDMSVSFFERRKRGDLIPTEEAKKKLDILQKLLECYETLCASDCSETIVIPHSVSMLASPRLQLFYINVLNKMPYRKNNIQIMLEEAESRLLNREIDFAVLAEPSEADQYNMILFMQTSMCIMAYPGHPLALKESVALSDVEKYRLICSQAYSGYLAKLQIQYPEISDRLRIEVIDAPVNAVHPKGNEMILGSHFSFGKEFNLVTYQPVMEMPDQKWYFCTLKGREEEKKIRELNERTKAFCSSFPVAES